MRKINRITDEVVCDYDYLILFLLNISEFCFISSVWHKEQKRKIINHRVVCDHSQSDRDCHFSLKQINGGDF